MIDAMVLGSAGVWLNGRDLRHQLAGLWIDRFRGLSSGFIWHAAHGIIGNV